MKIKNNKKTKRIKYIPCRFVRLWIFSLITKMSYGEKWKWTYSCATFVSYVTDYDFLSTWCAIAFFKAPTDLQNLKTLLTASSAISRENRFKFLIDVISVFNSFYWKDHYAHFQSFSNVDSLKSVLRSELMKKVQNYFNYFSFSTKWVSLEILLIPFTMHKWKNTREQAKNPSLGIICTQQQQLSRHNIPINLIICYYFIREGEKFT